MNLKALDKITGARVTPYRITTWSAPPLFAIGNHRGADGRIESVSVCFGSRAIAFHRAPGK